MNAPLNILMAEDSPDDAQLILLQLEQAGLEIEYRRVDTEAAFIAALDSLPDLILSDFAMPQFNGLRALQIVRERVIDIPFILISGTIGEEVAVEAMKLGADDYLMKDRLGRLGPAIQSVLNKKRLREEKARADLAVRNSEARFRSLIENSSDEVSIIDAQGILLYESPSSSPTLGYQTGEFLNKDLFQMVHPDDLERVQSLFKQLMRDPDLHPRDRFRLLHHNGTWHWVEAVGTNLLNEPAVRGIVVNYHDVTERVQTEEQIRYQALLLENVSDAVVSTDMDGIIKSWNKAAESMFGFTAAEAIGQLAMSLIQTEYLSASQEKVSAQLRGTGNWHGEVRVIRKDGVAIDSMSSVSIIRDSRDNTLGYVSLNHDITERKQVQARLQASESRYRLATRATNDVIWEWNAQTNQLTWAENAQFVFGYPPEEIGPDATWWDTRIHPEDRQRVLSKLYQVVRGSDLVWVDDYRFQLKDGSYATISDHGYIERDPTGQAMRMIGAMSDVTESKQAEKKIQRQLQQLNALRAIDIAISSTFDIKPSLAVLLNKVVSQLGVSAAAVLLFHPPTRTLEYIAGNGFTTSAIQQSRLRIGEGLAGQAALERHIVHSINLSQAGSNFVRAELLKEEAFVSYYAVPLIAKGELKGMLEIFHRAELYPDQEWLDFLETLGGQAAIAIDNAQLFENLQRSNIELERRVAERTAELNHTNIELESANRAKDEFLANMSHELRTPLNSIIGLSESLLEQRRGSLNDTQEKSLQTIESSGRHLLELITDILDLSKIEAGKFEYRPQLILVEDLCRSSLAFINSQAVKKSIKVTYQNETSISSLSADPRRLKQILINLLTNAVKFTPENGQVTLQVQTDPEQDRIQFSVIDTGIGIVPEDLQRLFQPFVQLDSTLSRQYDGTGLGLTLVQKLTDLHGGSVEVESEVGKGSRFTIHLPIGLETTEQSESAELDGALSGDTPGEKGIASFRETPARATILIAEDNAANILTLGDYLESHGYEIVIAHDGIEAIEKAESINPNIILMDIQMPVMNGLEAMAHLRMNPRFASTPIIALTALAMPGDRERCLKAGATEYMSKPVGLKLLAGTIAKLLNHAG
jgi:PAS domain S-box-containing protein